MIRDSLLDFFPELEEPGLIDDIEKHAILQTTEAGDKIMDLQGNISYMPFLVDGSIKILRQDDKGNELFLYYLLPGETCAMSLSCCLSGKKSEVMALTEEKSRMILIPVEFLESWMKYPSWKSFVMSTYRKRFDELLNTIDSIAFHNMDERLWRYLMDRSSARNSHTLSVTHKEIAYELNSTREVISRLLKQLEKQGKIELGRNRIELKV